MIVDNFLNIRKTRCNVLNGLTYFGGKQLYKNLTPTFVLSCLYKVFKHIVGSISFNVYMNSSWKHGEHQDSY